MDKVNVLHIRDSGGIYGAERVILSLGKYIDRKRFNCILLCMRDKDGSGESLFSRAKEIGIDAVLVDVNGRIDILALKKIRRILKKNSISILHTHDYKSNLYGLLSSINIGVKRVVTAHGATRDSFLQKSYMFLDERFFYDFFDKIIAVSEDISSYLKKIKIASHKIRTIQNGIDLALLQSENINVSDDNSFFSSLDQKVFSVIGRFVPDKGHRFFLKAFSGVLRKYPSSKALLVGDGPEKQEIGKQVNDLKLEKNVCLCGARSDMKNIYEKIDFVVIPSLREGLPYVLLEALASRIPILATAVGDIPVLIQNGRTGYLVPPGDTQALEKYMIELLRNPERAKEMGETGYKLVTEKFSAKRMVKDVEMLYDSLIQQ